MPRARPGAKGPFPIRVDRAVLAIHLFQGGAMSFVTEDNITDLCRFSSLI